MKWWQQYLYWCWEQKYRQEYERLMIETKQPETASKEVTPEDELATLGLTGASARLKEARELKRRLGIAYEHYRFVTPEQIEHFKSKLYKQTKRNLERSKAHPYGGETYDTLVLTPLESYLEVPPRQALDKLREAIKFKIFKRFEVATVESVTKLNDPIIFGLVEGCDNRFAICEWDDDVKISDLIKDDEG